MHPIAFRDYLKDIREYMTLAPGTKEHKNAFSDLCERLPDAETFDPLVKKWDRIVVTCLLISLIGFVSLTVLCLIAFHQAQQLFSPVQKKICLGLLALFFIPEIPMIYANMRKKQLSKAVMEHEIRSFGKKLNLLSEEQFARVQTLLNSDPEYCYGEEAPHPDDTCGCYECGHIFPADSPDLNWAEDLPSCPGCDSPFLVYGTAEVPVEKETLFLIQHLFFEEK